METFVGPIDSMTERKKKLVMENPVRYVINIFEGLQIALAGAPQGG